MYKSEDGALLCLVGDTCAALEQGSPVGGSTRRQRGLRPLMHSPATSGAVQEARSKALGGNGEGAPDSGRHARGTRSRQSPPATRSGSRPL